jgi:thiol-disulfide isomerase/thioredoxin
MRSIVKAFALFAAVAGISLGSLVAAGEPEVGKAPPEIKADGFMNLKGAAPSLASLKGKVVVVEFWATWCPPCRKSIPHLMELHEKHAKNGLVILGLTDEDKATVEPFIEKMKVNYIIGYGSKTGDEYGVRGIPTAFVVGADGKLVWHGHPMKPEFEKAIEDALAAAKPS